MALKNVELTRNRVASGLKNELVRIRVWLSTTDGNVAACDRLTDAALLEILAVCVENVMSHIGQETVLSASAEGKDRRSQAGKAARKFA